MAYFAAHTLTEILSSGLDSTLTILGLPVYRIAFYSFLFSFLWQLEDMALMSYPLPLPYFCCATRHHCLGILLPSVCSVSWMTESLALAYFSEVCQ